MALAARRTRVLRSIVEASSRALEETRSEWASSRLPATERTVERLLEEVAATQRALVGLIDILEGVLRP